MFGRHATIRRVWSRRVALEPTAFGYINSTHSNDNRLDFRRPAGQSRRPKPSLICHWIEAGGRLECRWEVLAGRDAPHDNPGRPGSPPDLLEPPRRRSLSAQFSHAT